MFQVTKKDETSLRVVSDDSGSLRELSEHFTFFVPGYKFIPSYRNRLWDGKIRLLNLRDHTLPYGLLEHLLQFAEERNYKVDLASDIATDRLVTDCNQFIKELPLTSGDNEIQARDYQTEAIKHALLNQRCVLLSPTGSGKSLIIYIIMRWFLEESDKKCLIIVPTTSLVEQMYKDFLDYSQSDQWFDDESMHKIYSGKEKINIDQRVIISTWQSIYKMPPSWFEDYEMIVGDEAHNFKAKSLTTIMNKLKNAWLRIGTTGTLDGTDVHQLVLEGCFGPVYKVTTTKALMDSNTLSQMKVEGLVIKYNDHVRKKFGKKKYQEEIDWLVSHPLRNKFIRNLALDQKGNTLVLYNYVIKHGKPLYKDILDKAEGRKVFFVAGEVGADERERIRELTEKENNAIIVASMGTFSTGINIRNLHNIIFASPTKSQIRVLQSIGRGLRKSENGQETTIYDISDDISWNKRKNYTLNHAIDRAQIYVKEKFRFKTHLIEL